MENKKTFERYCSKSLDVLKARYETTRIVKHNATCGSIREQIIKDFLSEHLPEIVSVVSGQIFDSNDNYSKQQDLVLVSKAMPRLPFADGNDLIFLEGVISTVEIKTKINKTVLEAIGKNIASVRDLTTAMSGGAMMGVTHDWPPSRILTVIVTYEGLGSLKQYHDILNELPEEQHPDLLLDLSKGLLVKNHGFLIPKQQGKTFLAHENPGKGFMFFLTFLIEITGTLGARSVFWRSYT
ncbi:DUF6602 domain-containing protein [Vibrio splendidus]|uniref:DUF6602 domain-containing protein n=1 Tax=Vibrio splendidus TaxID=29497 RepID=UPI00352F1595